MLPDGEITALSNVARLKYNRGFESLRHSGGALAVNTQADVNFSVNNANAVRGQLARDVLPRLSEELGVRWSFGGDAAEQAESVGDISLALPLALISIFIILAWVFGSYLWPLAVLSVIPFGLVGAIFGHWLLGFDVSMLSIFGFFGLSGIVINDSIILVVAYQQARKAGMPAVDAAVEAGCKRLRAVLLTSVTTIAGIMPLLLETDQQAQFLKPMVISIGFRPVVRYLHRAVSAADHPGRPRKPLCQPCCLAVRSDFARRLKSAVPSLKTAVATGNPIRADRIRIRPPNPSGNENDTALPCRRSPVRSSSRRQLLRPMQRPGCIAGQSGQQAESRRCGCGGHLDRSSETARV